MWLKTMKNNKLIIVVIIIIAIVVAVSLLNSNSSKKKEETPATNSIQTPSKTALETVENSEGGVTVGVTPLNLSPDSTTWDFEISLSTHSVDLGQDLAVVSELVSDGGKTYKPYLWEGDPPGGHHRSGILKFKPIVPQPKSIQVKITDIGGIPVRTFSWTLK